MNRSLVSWALYDIANTVFNLGVVGLFFPLWINQRQGATDADLGFPIAASMVIVLISSPFLGALTDQLNGRIRIFTFLNIVAAIGTFLIGITSSLGMTLISFSLAFVCVYLAELQYNALLAQISTPKNRGKVGGIGIGLGYLGSLVVILLALQYSELTDNLAVTFQILGGIFLLTAIPITLFFVEIGRKPNPSKRSIIISTWAQLQLSFFHFKQNPSIIRFFTARYFYMIAVTTSSTFAVLYGIKTIGFTERQVELVLFLGTVVAIPSALLWGYLVDKVGPITALKWNLTGWTIILVGALVIPLMGLDNRLWWILSVVTGLCYGGLWVADRPLLIQLSSSMLGEMFGIYGAISRSAFLTGSLVWPFIAVTLGMAQTTSVLFLICCMLIGLFLVSGLQNQRSDDLIQS